MNWVARQWNGVRMFTILERVFREGFSKMMFRPRPTEGEGTSHVDI